MRFNYRPEEIPISETSKRTKTIWRPIIPIILMKGTKMVGFEALIDSGADNNIFPSEISDVLNIKLKSGKSRKILGISGEPIKGYIHKVEFKLVGMKSFAAPVIFSSQMSKHSLGVLGNTGFFDNFKVEFDYKRKLFEIN